MKKIYIAMAALVAVTLISCEREKSFNDTPLEKNEMRIALQGSASTRSHELMQPQKFSYLMDKDEKTGEAFYLEEVVEDLNYASLATRGTPAYTENVGKLYHNMNVVAKNGEEETAINFWAMDDAQQEGSGWRYRGMFEWEEDSYDFYMSMPEDMTSKGVSNLSYANNMITFNYAPVDTTAATSLQDLIFAARTITKADAEAKRVDGVPVLFHHALTGVKFRIANNDELTHGKTGHTQTYITKVAIKGLKDSGTCTITPRKETEQTDYTDNTTGDYSSGDLTYTDGVVAWTYGLTTHSYSQEYTEAQNITAYSGSTTDAETGSKTSGSFAKNGNYPDTFSGAGNTYNLNDDDASMTFWFIPQALTEKVTIDVEFHVWDGNKNRQTNKLTLKLGEEVLKMTDNDKILTREWKAGQLRTFSLKPLHVDVELEDKMDTRKWVKSDVYIKNTGNVPEYVRVNMIGNWVGKRQIMNNVYNDYESVLMGYKDTLKDEHGVYLTALKEVERWNDKDFTWVNGQKVYPQWTAPTGTYDYEPYGVFDGLPAMGTSTSGGEMIRNWIRHDKFYYYTKPIGPGEDLPDTEPLFFSYEIGKSPVFYIADNNGVRRAAKDVHFVMDLSVQAIAVPINGTDTTSYDAAWKAALNVTNLNDL